MYKAGIDIGGTKINAGIIDEDGKIIINRAVKVCDIADLGADISKLLWELAFEAGIKKEDVLSCGAGVPGTVSDDGKKLIKAPNIDILSEDTAAVLQKSLGIPVRMIQDSRAAAWAEYKLFGKPDETLISFALGTGIGTGIVMGGKIYNGANGCAGEIGHIPVVLGGRKCGCGKEGCLEKYCAGGGLDITAAEILGKGHTAADLFSAARQGNKTAKQKTDEAVIMLGNAIIGAINLLAPDRIVFSGGLSEQEEMYISPVIEYVSTHCYNAAKIPEMSISKMGADLPLIGAAMCAPAGRRPLISASLMCADVLDLADAIDDIRSAGIDYIHCDIMDNHFVPNLMLPPDLINRLHDYSGMPFDFHIMAYDPQSVIDRLTVKKGDIVSVHCETVPNIEKVLCGIKEKGALAAVAVNPDTPIYAVCKSLFLADIILLMTVYPGFSGQAIVPGSFDKIKSMRAMLDEMGYDDIPIEVDGNCSFENVPKMYEAGAEIFVGGTSSVFKSGISIKEGTKRLLSSLSKI